MGLVISRMCEFGRMMIKFLCLKSQLTRKMVETVYPWGSLPYGLSGQGWAQLKPGGRGFILVWHMEGGCPSTSPSSAALPGAAAGSCTEAKQPGLKPHSQLGDWLQGVCPNVRPSPTFTMPDQVGSKLRLKEKSSFTARF